MTNQYAHIQDRINRRDIDTSVPELAEIAKLFQDDTAVILGKRVSDEGIRFGYVLIVLIVRNRLPKTIMFRRQDQNFDKRNFNVSRVVYL